ncbi:MAG: pyridoxamine 5'-phosphate oxidase family protein [Ilumatobacteraceae bacterium]
MSEPIGERPRMPDYGVDSPEWQALPWSWAAERLGRTRNYWVTTVSPAGQPHSLPVWGVWHDESRQFSFSCAPGAAKARHLAHNPLMVFTTTDTIECVSVEGTAVRSTEAGTIAGWVPRYVAKYGDEVGPDFGDFLGANAMFVVTPSVAFAMIERADEFSTRATRWRFTT